MTTVSRLSQPTAPRLALESTVISHGLPFPANLELALRVEEIARAEGATPATVGIIRGEIVVGLNRAQIEHLATAKDVHKTSRRDLPIVVAHKSDGATMVVRAARPFDTPSAPIYNLRGGIHIPKPAFVSSDSCSVSQRGVV